MEYDAAVCHIRTSDHFCGWIPRTRYGECVPLCRTTLGRISNATFGNAAELIIAIFLVRVGLFDMVKASLTGAIIGNLLLVLGLSVFVGGLKFKTQRFNADLAGMNGSLMLLAVYIILGVSFYLV